MSTSNALRCVPVLASVALAASAIALCGCDGSSNTSGGGKTPTNTGGPTSIYGKTAAMGKDVVEQTKQAGEQANQTAAAMAGTANHTEIGGLLWAIPEGWTKTPTSSSMRLAEFKAGEGGAASVRFFAIGGGAEENISRWRGQVANPLSTPTNKTINAGPLKISTFAATGTYAGMGPSGAATAPAENTRFLGAYVEGAGQPVQLVITGPDHVVRDIEKAWELMLAGVLKK